MSLEAARNWASCSSLLAARLSWPDGRYSWANALPRAGVPGFLSREPFVLASSPVRGAWGQWCRALSRVATHHGAKRVFWKLLMSQWHPLVDGGGGEAMGR